MSALLELRKLLGADRSGGSGDATGTVIEVADRGRVMVRTARRTVSCTTVVPVMVGDTVKVQGSLIVSRQVAPADSLPEFRV